MDYPKIGEEFELTLTQDQCDPIAMVKKFGYDNFKGWKHTGSKVEPKTIKCKLVQVGYCSNLDEVKEKLEAYGEIPEGQFLQSFLTQYQKPDGNGPVGIADASWFDPHGFINFLHVGSDGSPNFRWPDHSLLGAWRWLVLSK